MHFNGGHIWTDENKNVSQKTWPQKRNNRKVSIKMNIKKKVKIKLFIEFFRCSFVESFLLVQLYMKLLCVLLLFLLLSFISILFSLFPAFKISMLIILPNKIHFPNFTRTFVCRFIAASKNTGDDTSLSPSQGK